jgi:lysophospholipase L1-like esterase
MLVTHLLATESPQPPAAKPPLPKSDSVHPMARQDAMLAEPAPIQIPPNQPPEFSPKALHLQDLLPLQHLSDSLSPALPSQAASARPMLNPPPATPITALPNVGSYATTSQVLALAIQQVSAPSGPRPRSGSQLYQQRRLALQAGSLYTRLAPDSFYGQWRNATAQPTYDQWKTLLSQEATAMAAGQGSNRLTVVLGDSLSLWLPPELLPRNSFWLNQGISGDTTRGVLNRLSAFSQTRPNTIHVMAGVNDLKTGATDAEILSNLRQIMQRLRQQHPQARIIVHSILPTRLVSIPSQRIRILNSQIAQMTQQQRVDYLDLHPSFADGIGNLRYELTTDGLHLSRLGYQVWRIAMLAV